MDKNINADRHIMNTQIFILSLLLQPFYKLNEPFKKSEFYKSYLFM